MVRRELAKAAQEEQDHLAWTQSRLTELKANASLFNPLWYAGAFAMGSIAAKLGDGVSLGFVAETETQVSEHLRGHLDALPAADVRSAAIVAQMKADEEQHGAQATNLGALPLPPAAKTAMRGFAKVMTTVAYRI
jgi:3-demethoxyubiquinol 3-hydroxylase